jgi:hypothetical protein
VLHLTDALCECPLVGILIVVDRTLAVQAISHGQPESLVGYSGEGPQVPAPSRSFCNAVSRLYCVSSNGINHTKSPCSHFLSASSAVAEAGGNEGQDRDENVVSGDK